MECPCCGQEDAYFDAGVGKYYCPWCNKYFGRIFYSKSFFYKSINNM